MNVYSLKRHRQRALTQGTLCGALVLFLFMPNIVLPQNLGSTQSPASYHSLGLRLGSVGWGAEYKAQVHPHLDLRLVWQTLSPGRFEVKSEIVSETVTETIYQAQGSFRSSGFIADWHPWETPIRFSFGVLQNRSGFRLREQSPSNGPTNQYDANFGQLGYFFGTGWAPRYNSNRLTLTLDVGLLAQQPPRLTWIEDSIIRNAEETDRIWSERSRLTEELEEYKILPFFMIGLSFTFI